MTTVKQVLKHHPDDVRAGIPVVETPFCKWLVDNEFDNYKLHAALAAYYDVEKQELEGQFQGDIEYEDDDGSMKSMSVHDHFKYTFDHYCRQVYVPPQFREAKTIDDYIDLSTWRGSTPPGEIYKDIPRPRGEIYVRVNGLAPEYLEDQYHYFASGYVASSEALCEYAGASLIYGNSPMSSYCLDINVEPPEGDDPDNWIATIWIRYQSICGRRHIGREVKIPTEVIEVIENWRGPRDIKVFAASSVGDMPKGGVQIRDEIRQILSELQWDDGACKIASQLQPNIYKQVNVVLNACGGKWKRGPKYHEFDSDGEFLIKMAVDDGWYMKPVDYDKLLQWYETPESLAEEVVDRLDVEEGKMYLEPSAGEAAIAQKIRNRYGKVHCIELSEERVNVLDTRMFSFERADFLECPVDCIYDGVAMNPPFSKSQDMRHVLHAFEFLKPGGVLVSIMSTGWEFYSTKLAQQFRAFFDEHDGEKWPIARGAFKDAGTMVSTLIVRLRKPE